MFLRHCIGFIVNCFNVMMGMRERSCARDYAQKSPGIDIPCIRICLDEYSAVACLYAFASVH